MSTEVTEYISKQKSPQKEICRMLRRIILKNFPEVNEELSMGVPLYDGKFYIVALKKHVNLGFSIRGMNEKEISNFEGSGKTMRHKKFFKTSDINEEEIVKLLKLVKAPWK